MNVVEQDIIYCPGCGQRLSIAGVEPDIKGYALCCCPACQIILRLGLRKMNHYIDIRALFPKQGGDVRGG